MENTSEHLLDDVNQELNFKKATPGTRFVNYLIDIIAFTLIIQALSSSGFFEFVMHHTYFFYKGDPVVFQIETYLLNLGIFILYYTLSEGSTKGKTLGKLITRTRVIKPNGYLINWKDAFLRSLSRLVPFEAFSALKGFPWHDRWTKTLVVGEDNLA